MCTLRAACVRGAARRNERTNRRARRAREASEAIFSYALRHPCSRSPPRCGTPRPRTLCFRILALLAHLTHCTGGSKPRQSTFVRFRTLVSWTGFQQTTSWWSHLLAHLHCTYWDVPVCCLFTIRVRRRGEPQGPLGGPCGSKGRDGYVNTHWGNFSSYLCVD